MVRFIFALAVLAASAAAEPLTISGSPRVIDGDTIVIDGIHIQLQGLDAEELNMAHGQQSRAAMLDIVGNHIITCRPDGTHSYERIVATCLLPDGTDISRELVRRGLALDFAHFSHGRYRADEPAGVRQQLYQAPYFRFVAIKRVTARRARRTAEQTVLSRLICQRSGL